jgi:uncharacterized protein YukE
MSLPPISPTGAMASGDYVDYMVEYLNYAMDSELDQLEYYLSGQVFDAWGVQWDRQITDLNSAVVALSSRINKLSAQARMATDAINKL